MASELTNFFIKLTSTFDPAGLKAADDAIVNTTKKTEKLTNSFEAMGKLFVSGAALYKTIDFAKQSFYEFARQEQAVIKLNAALKNNGIYSDAFSKRLQGIASNIQNVTTVGDEVTLEILQLASTMGISGDRMEYAARSAIGLSKAFDIELKSSMRLVALALKGNYDLLSRHLPQIRDAKTDTEKAAIANRVFADSFNLATAETRTALGSLQQAGNMVGELKEKLGKLIATPLTPWLKDVNTVLGWFNDLTGVSKSEIEKLKDEILSLSKVLAAVNRQGIGIKDGEVFNKRDAENLRTQIDVKLAELKALRAASGSVGGAGLNVAAPSATAGVNRFPTGKLELYKTPLDDFKSYLAEKTRMQEEFDQERFDAAQYWAQLETQKRQAVIATAWSNIISLANSSNETLATIGKAGAILQATMNAHTAATQAMASVPFPLNIAAAAISYAAAMAHVAEISGLALATGGLISPTSGGTFARIAEAGKPEAVIPLDDARTKNKLRDTFGMDGAGTNVTLNNTFNFGAINSQMDVKKIAIELSEATRRGVAWAVENAKINYKIGQKKSGDTTL